MTSRSEQVRYRASVFGADLPWVNVSGGVVREVGAHTFVEYGTYLCPLDDWHETEAEAVRSTLPRLEEHHARLGELIAAVREGRSTVARPGERGPSAAGAAQPERRE